MVVYSYNPTLERLRQENPKCKTCVPTDSKAWLLRVVTEDFVECVDVVCRLSSLCFFSSSQLGCPSLSLIYLFISVQHGLSWSVSLSYRRSRCLSLLLLSGL